MRTSRAYIAGFGTAGALVAAAAVMFVFAGAVVSWKGWPGVSVAAPTGAVLVEAPHATPAASKPLVVVPVKVTIVHPAVAVTKVVAPAVSSSGVQPRSVAKQPTTVTPPTTATKPTSTAKPSTGTSSPTTPTPNNTLGGTVDGVGSLLGSQVSGITQTLGTVTGGLSPGLGATVTNLGQGLSNVLTGVTGLLGGLLGGGHTGGL